MSLIHLSPYVKQHYVEAKNMGSGARLLGFQPTADFVCKTVMRLQIES